MVTRKVFYDELTLTKWIVGWNAKDAKTAFAGALIVGIYVVNAHQD